MKDEKINEVVSYYIDDKENQFALESFLSQVEVFFTKNPILNQKPFPIIHSLKSRFKDPDHLRDKLKRKAEKGQIVDKDCLFQEINDLIGVRVLFLYQDQFSFIHNEILRKVNDLGDWAFIEEPKAYTWDPESEKQYDALGITTEVRDTFYTSVHYIVKPNNNKNFVCCEIQVRTLFEEIWGEIDHTINYPHPTENIACKEQLRVLSKLVSTGTRLADSIFRCYNDDLNNTDESSSKQCIIFSGLKPPF